MLRKLSFAFIFLLVSGLACSRAWSQKLKFKAANKVSLNDTLTFFGQSDIFTFPNINKIKLYADAGKLKQIQQAEKKHNEQEMYRLLLAYIKNFGIENFSKNIPMLWKLAPLSEKFGRKGEAVLLYKLILKHHQQGINIKELYTRYNALETDKKENYVDLNFYYKLVDYRKEIDTLRPPHSVLIRMDDIINSGKEDYGPTMGNADHMLLFTSKRNEHEQRAYNEDLFYTLKVDDAWTPAQEFKKINTQYNEGSACLNKNGKELYFSRCNAPGGIGNCDLYVATLGKDSTWTNIKNLGASINSSDWDSHPSLSHRGDTLFFASTRAGGFGLSDIYFSVKDKKGKWQRAKNMGPIVNTLNSEVSPFYHHKFNVLYYSSNGQPLNFGGFDIYKTYRQKGNWTEPKNIGPLVNGAGDEYYFTIDSQSRDLYYARSHQDDKKNLDLYSFPVPMEAQPEAITRLRGSLIDQNGKPLGGIVSVIDLDKGVEVAPKNILPDGSFGFELINKRRYLLIIQGDDYFRIEEIFFLNGDKEINKVAEPLQRKIAFRSLEFENGKADILSSMHQDLAKLGNFLIDHPQNKLIISGHTDSSGDENLNLRLSQNRANAIKAYLVQEFKLPESRISATGYGSSLPIIQKEETETHKQMNRRVEFEIVN
jgi:outer membrane protein OmpA-like peptidoglycan-associated protein